MTSRGATFAPLYVLGQYMVNNCAIGGLASRGGITKVEINMREDKGREVAKRFYYSAGARSSSGIEVAFGGNYPLSRAVALKSQ